VSAVWPVAVRLAQSGTFPGWSADPDPLREWIVIVLDYVVEFFADISQIDRLSPTLAGMVQGSVGSVR
jgi:hypothetical protein